MKEQLPIEFIIWYSGMTKEKIIKAYEKWKKENEEAQEKAQEENQ